jgi:hypothetical protein
VFARVGIAPVAGGDVVVVVVVVVAGGFVVVVVAGLLASGVVADHSGGAGGVSTVPHEAPRTAHARAPTSTFTERPLTPAPFRLPGG